MNARYEAALPPFISIVWTPCRPVISVPETQRSVARKPNLPDYMRGNWFFFADAAFLSTIGSFLLQWSFFAYSRSFGVSLLTVGALLVRSGGSLLTIEALCVQWESASNKRLNGL